MLARPVLTAILVSSLALGIGANAVIFSLATGILFGATPYPDPGRVVVVWFTPPDNPGARVLATDANCAALRERMRSFQHIGCVLPDRSATLNEVASSLGAGVSVRVSGQEFTAGVAEALGAAPVLGRWFTEDEEARREPVAVISHTLWQRQFGGAVDIVGRPVHVTNRALTSEAATIIGVAPEGFHLFDAGTDYWLPLPIPRAAPATSARRLIVVGRMKPAVTLPQAQSEASAIAAALADEAPFTNRGWDIRVEPVQATVRSGIGRPLLILQSVVAMVLLIACANVAGLLLADGVSRQGEMAVRSALGASRGRLLQQGLTESALLAIAGAAVGIAGAWAGLRMLVAWLPAGIPGLGAVSLDASVLASTGAVSLLAGLASGISPACAASRVDVAHALKMSGREGLGATSGQRLRNAFVIGQLALAVVLSVGASLMIQSLVRLQRVETGAATDGLMTFRVQLDGRDYVRGTGRITPSGAAETELQSRLFDAADGIRERLTAIAGVDGVTAVAATVPLSGVARTYGLVATGSPATPPDGPAWLTEWSAVLPDYFATLDVPVLRGREFDVSDTNAGLPVAIINRSMADELWPGQDPIGRDLQLNLFNEPSRRVVGVVADVRQRARSEGRHRQVYVPFAQLSRIQSATVSDGLEQLTFIVRAAGQVPPSIETLRGIVDGVDPAKPVTHVLPLDRYVTDQLDGFRQYVILLALFAGVAFTLAIVGAYGLMAHAVRRRVREIAIRRVLGATSGQVLRLVLQRGLVVSTAGVALGAWGAISFATVLEAYLWEVRALDPVTFIATPAALGAVSMASCYVAIRRALEVQPVVAMRQD